MVSANVRDKSDLRIVACGVPPLAHVHLTEHDRKDADLQALLLTVCPEMEMEVVFINPFLPIISFVYRKAVTNKKVQVYPPAHV